MTHKPLPEFKPVKREAWDDNLADSMPKRSRYFDTIRTQAYRTKDLVADFIHFWVALKVDGEEDKWRVMHYIVHDLDKPTGQFISEALKDAKNQDMSDLSFIEAVAALGRQEGFSNSTFVNKPYSDADLEALYPVEKHPALKDMFYSAEYYKRAANIEGLVFDQYNEPHRRIEGKIFANATFDRAEIVNAMRAAEEAQDNPRVRADIEGGILSDIFNSVSARSTKLDDLVKMGKVLAKMDEFAALVGGLYLSVQKMTDKKIGYETIEGFATPLEKENVFKVAEANAYLTQPTCDKIVRNIIPQMKDALSDAADLGVHVEPFQKFTAECEVYLHLLNVSQNRDLLEQSFLSPNAVNVDAVTKIRTSVEAACRAFLDLGGTEEKMDDLKVWAADKKKDPIPPWLPGFLTRYYQGRSNVMKKVQEKRAGGAQVRTLAAEVKPPLPNGGLPNAGPATTAPPKP